MGSASREHLLYRLWTAVSLVEASKVGSAHSSITISDLGVRIVLMKGAVPRTAALRWNAIEGR